MFNKWIISFLLLFIGTALVHYKSISQSAEDLKYLDSMLQILPDMKEDSAKSETLVWIAWYKFGNAQQTGNWDDAILWANRALIHSKKTNFRFGIGRSNHTLGLAYMQKGDYPMAIKYHTDALKASMVNARVLLTVISYYKIGECYTYLENYNEAQRSFKTELALLEKMDYPDDSQLRATRDHTIMKLGNLYITMKDFPEALRTYETLLKNTKFVSKDDIRLKMALAQIELHQYNDALENLNASLPFFEEQSKTREYEDYQGVLGQTYLSIGEVNCKLGFIKSGDESIQYYREAIIPLQKALPMLQQAGSKENQMHVYDLLKTANESTGNFKQALLYNQLYHQLRDSVFNKSTYLKLADLQVQIETEKKEASFQLQREQEKRKNDQLLAEQAIIQEKELLEQELNQDRKLVRINEKHKRSIEEEKLSQEKIRLEEKHLNNLMLMILALLIVTSTFLFLYYRQRQAKNRAIERAEAIHKMAELELQSLRAQLNPHFMFNSLNSLQTLILREETDASQSYLARFARLLRLLLDNADSPFIPLEKEIEFLKLYLGIESLRMPDMKYSIEIDPAIKINRELIPNMLLQPYVENAIWHGLSHKESDKTLQIRIFRTEVFIQYEIEDNGVGRQKSEALKSLFRKQHTSKGMELINKRINLINKEYLSGIEKEITDVMQNGEVAGTLVTIKIPIILANNLERIS